MLMSHRKHDIWFIIFFYSAKGAHGRIILRLVLINMPKLGYSCLHVGDSLRALYIL